MNYSFKCFFNLSFLFFAFNFIGAQSEIEMPSKFGNIKRLFYEKVSDLNYKVASIKSSLSGLVTSIKDMQKTFSSWIVDKLEKLESDGELVWQLLFAFLAGLSVSFTPCIYPLIPITIGILSSRGRISQKTQMLRVLFYLLGISIVFAGLGVLCAYFGLIFGSFAGNKWMIMLSVGFFFFLALTMLDVIEVDYSLLQINAPNVSSVFSAFLYGAVTGIVASPCSTPALLSLLGFVAEKNNPMLAFMLLCSFAIGMTFLVILFSIFSNLLMLMPKPGRWMVEVRHFLGFGILFLCVDFASNPSIISAIWQRYLMLSIIWSAIAFYYFTSSKKDSVTKIILAHREHEQASDDIIAKGLGITRVISFGLIIKKAFSYIALFCAIYYFGKTYLSFNRTKMRSILVKMLK
jgi:thiol:disulfide interchange protein DsbD